MHLRQSIAGPLAILILLVLVVFGTNPQVGADPGPDDEGPTAIGEAVDTSVTTPSGEEMSSVRNDRTLAGAVALNRFTYLPVLTNARSGPQAQEAQTVVKLVNAQRSLAGCEPLRISQQLTSAAQGHSQDMAINDFFSHVGSDGRSPWERVSDTGYEFSFGAENIAAGYSTAEAAVNAWMNSYGHRANILNCKLKETGVGFYYLKNDTGSVNYRYYWTQVFATP